MKLGSFEINGGLRLGAFEDQQVVDLNAAYAAYLADMGAPDPQKRADAELPDTMLALIASHETALPAAQKALDFVKSRVFQERDDPADNSWTFAVAERFDSAGQFRGCLDLRRS